MITKLQRLESGIMDTDSIGQKTRKEPKPVWVSENQMCLTKHSTSSDEEDEVKKLSKSTLSLLKKYDYNKTNSW